MNDLLLDAIFTLAKTGFTRDDIAFLLKIDVTDVNRVMDYPVTARVNVA